MIARNVAKLLGDGVVKRSDTDGTLIKSLKNGLIVSYGTDKANFSNDFEDCPSSRFKEMAEEFFTLLIDNLELTSVTRVGHRQVYQKRFPSLDEAKKYVGSAAKHFGVDAAVFSKFNDFRLSGKSVTEFIVKFEDENTGIRLESTTNQSTYIAPHWATESQREGTTSKTFYNAVCDVDTFTIKPIATDQISIIDILSGNKKMLETRILPYFEL